MADTRRTLAQILALWPLNTSGDISPQDGRDMIVTLTPSLGQIHQIDNVAATVISDTTNFFALNMSATTLDASSNFDSPATGQLRYTGLPPVKALCWASLSMTSGSSNQVTETGFGINGTAIDVTHLTRKIGSGADAGAVSNVHILDLVTNDIVSMFIKNVTGANNVTIGDMHLVIAAFVIA